jgi:valyl-tRNA synthetase
LSNKKFLDNAPDDIIAKEQEKKESLDAKMAKIVEAEERFRKLA